MRAVGIKQPGGIDALEVFDLPVPAPKAGEVVVKVEAAGVNFIDTYYRSGVYKAPQLPLVLGSEGAGIIESVGSDVDGFAKGDRVAWAMVLGSYAEYAAVPATRLVKVPAGVSSRDAAAVLLQGMTAHYLSESTFPLKPGHVALVHAGAGGVGLLLTQMAKAKGATVITTVSTDAKAKLSKEAGADHTIDYTRDDFAAEVRKLTGGKGADVVYDSVGKTTFEKSLDSLRPRGYLVVFGGSSGPVPPFDLQVLNAKGSLFLTRPSLAHYTLTPEELSWRSDDVFTAVREGRLKVRAERDYPLTDAARAHADLEGRKTTGKLLLIP
ncbi:MAG: quinone oxidoreductase [Candidatus Eremiobacteraeota bacterium]|nr:quinone oxidoreductase [Candidatus Eremiobacteraeota bacterium]